MVEKRPLRPPVEVMLARAVDAVPGAHALPGGVQYEQKWDGYRLVAFSGRATLSAHQRSGPRDVLERPADVDHEDNGTPFAVSSWNQANRR